MHHLVESLRPEQLTAVVIVGLCVAATTIIVVVAIVAALWAKTSTLRARSALTRQLLERGADAEEIARVLGAQGHSLPGAPASPPCACEAVVESDGAWYPALVLQASRGRYYIHYVGHDMDSNEWVGEDRIRFPAGSALAEPAAESSPPSRNGLAAKPPVELEL